MGMEADKVQVSVEEVTDSNPGADGTSVVVETESIVDGELRDTSIEVREADAPAVAVALLNTEASTSKSTGPDPRIRWAVPVPRRALRRIGTGRSATPIRRRPPLYNLASRCTGRHRRTA